MLGKKSVQSRQPIEHSPLRLLFREAIWATDLSHAELARRSGLDRSTISYLMNGHREGRIESWETLLQAAGVRIDYELEYEDG